ncbi:HigA family addiction module antitoxin [Stenotrophomonas oahuensis]|uniref:HigA family addiction module antitoxin n=1 Tax=Stenotrophomonas oahuensis TaxID=3003271 RepID=A0ABY9YNR5_9GAMM|nr:HigA family addiction module antitoxin [Stenotrophomonas sp. A5586]WNH52557.1 HigA family addiction module antitoxin [Stenotrophomonas sp. A5586]
MSSTPSSEPTPPLHPGEILRDDFMRPRRLSNRALACAIHVSSTRIAGITRGATAITADTAHRLGCYFNTSPWFWMNLQTRFDLEKAELQVPHPKERIVPLPVSVDPTGLEVQDGSEWGLW